MSTKGKRPRGLCPVCMREFAITEYGDIWAHIDKSTGKYCSGVRLDYRRPIPLPEEAYEEV